MTTDKVNVWVKDAVCASTPELGANVRSRALDAMVVARPARGISRRLVIAAVGIAVLVGLGFVPIPMGKAPGALERALAQAEQATTVHIATWFWSSKGTTTVDEWLSDSFHRREGWAEGGRRRLMVAVGPWRLDLTEPRAARESYVPCYLQPAPMPDRAQFERRFAEMRYIAQFTGQPEPPVSYSEHRESSLWGAAINVVEATWTVEESNQLCFGGPYAKGDHVSVRAEIDASMNRLFSVREYRLANGRWQQTYEATYEWDVEIPEDLKQVELPKGTKLTRYSWWENRAGQALAQADTRDWIVTVHAIDVKRNGDVLLSLSRVETPESQMPSVYNSAPPLVVEAASSSGERYVQQDGYSCYNARHSGYWTTTLKPDNPNVRPRSITLTVWPYRHEPSEDQSVTFRNIPLPPRQNTDDLFAAETEVIQY